jgi:hypothetical protein
MILRAITVHAPWSWAIAQNLKPYENRPKRYSYRGPLLIHAGKHYDPHEYAEDCDAIEELGGRRPPAIPELGGIVGATRLVDCAAPLDHSDGWRAPGQYGLRLQDSIPLPFRGYRGAQGIFFVELTPPEVDALRRAHLVT